MKSGITNRVMLTLFGAITGYASWYCFDWISDNESFTRINLLICSFILYFSYAVMIVAGRLNLKLTIITGFAIGAVLSSLIVGMSYRFEPFQKVFDYPMMWVASSLMFYISIPVFIAEFSEPRGWRDYDRLFKEAWLAFIRLIIAGLFTGLAWLVFWLSIEILHIVNITVLKDLLREDWFPAAFCGLSTGFGLAITLEFSKALALIRGLVVLLWRAILPIMLIVIVVFLVALVNQSIKMQTWGDIGFTSIFSDLSTSGTLMALVAFGIVFITSAVDGNDEEAATNIIMVVSTRILSLLLPIIATIACYGIWIRVNEYGWTPKRVFVAISAVILLSYSVIYALSFIKGSKWRDVIRRGNIAMAGIVVLVSGLSFTPLLNDNKISTDSQIARIKTGKSELQNVPIWEMVNEWGASGLAGISALKANDQLSEQDKLLARIEVAEIENQWNYDQHFATYNNDRDTDRKDAIEALKTLSELERFPKNSEIPEFAISNLTDNNLKPSYTLMSYLGNCHFEKNSPDQCFAVIEGFSTQCEGDELLLFRKYKSGVNLNLFLGCDNNGVRSVSLYSPEQFKESNLVFEENYKDFIAKLRAGNFKMVPSSNRMLEVGGIQIFEGTRW